MGNKNTKKKKNFEKEKNEKEDHCKILFFGRKFFFFFYEILINQKGNGRSTIFKHLIYIFKEIPNEETLEHFMKEMESNIFLNLKNFCESKGDQLLCNSEYFENVFSNVSNVLEEAKKILELKNFEELYNYYYFNSSSIDCPSYVELKESVEKFEKIKKGEKKFNVIDSLKVKHKNSLIEKDFKIGELNFKMIDYIRPRNNRKWIHLFDRVDFIFYSSSLIHFSMAIKEDQFQNAMNENLKLFSEVCSIRWFEMSKIFVFLTVIFLNYT